MKNWAARLHRRIHDFEDRRDAPKLGALGPGSRVLQPSLFHHAERVFVGSNSTIHPYCRIEVITENPHLHGPALSNEGAQLIIGDRVVINAFTHIGVMGRVELQHDVGIASGVCIEDHHYEYETATDLHPLKQQGFRVSDVLIEAGAMIGEHVTILPGVTIGRNSWIGANSVVTKNVPPYSVAAGIPARVIRRRDPESGNWIRV